MLAWRSPDPSRPRPCRRIRKRSVIFEPDPGSARLAKAPTSKVPDLRGAMPPVSADSGALLSRFVWQVARGLRLHPQAVGEPRERRKRVREPAPRV